MTWTSTPRAEALELAAIEQLVGRAAAVQEDDPLERVPPGERRVQRRPERREPDPTGGDDEVAALGSLDRPRGPVGASDPQDAAALELADGARRGPATRIVWTSRSRRAGSPLIEIGTSPAPNE